MSVPVGPETDEATWVCVCAHMCVLSCGPQLIPKEEMCFPPVTFFKWSEVKGQPPAADRIHCLSQGHCSSADAG